MGDEGVIGENFKLELCEEGGVLVPYSWCWCRGSRSRPHSLPSLSDWALMLSNPLIAPAAPLPFCGGTKHQAFFRGKVVVSFTRRRQRVVAAGHMMGGRVRSRSGRRAWRGCGCRRLVGVTNGSTTGSALKRLVGRLRHHRCQSVSDEVGSW